MSNINYGRVSMEEVKEFVSSKGLDCNNLIEVFDDNSYYSSDELRSKFDTSYAKTQNAIDPETGERLASTKAIIAVFDGYMARDSITLCEEFIDSKGQYYYLFRPIKDENSYIKLKETGKSIGSLANEDLIEYSSMATKRQKFSSIMNNATDNAKSDNEKIITNSNEENLQNGH